MALKFTLPFPVFAPPSPNGSPSQPPHLTTTRHRPPTEIRFSRWNNANAAEFNERRRAQEEIEEDIRRERRFSSIDRISQIDESSSVAAAAASASGTVFKSTGTPSSPSRPSIPGKKSKYSKPPPRDSHPAFSKTLGTQSKGISPSLSETPIKKAANVVLSDDGLSFAIDGAPFEFKYSYTETPKVRPLRLRETPYAPFGPTTMQRPWTGRAPLPASKKKLKEFDSFNLPPPGKKGVKPIQAPGPYLPGTAPRYAKSREEILGEPLTSEEVKDLIRSCVKSERQLNMGRDGLTHNMLDNIHAHWKRRRVCKIKCKGVCTVDMDNVKQQLEERTGGKIIHSTGGVIYLFRGRNYNYRTRPRFPLMLWKPITPVYPRLIQRAPEGLTVQEATAMRKKGRSLIPICKLGKNGVYFKLAPHVREAFEECELVRINCQGLNPSDYRKIGGKLKDLVPCVLISFEDEHILMWRGRDWKSSLPASKTDQSSAVIADSSSSDAEAKKLSSSSSVELLTTDEDNETESLESDFSDSDEDDEDSADTEQEQSPLTETESCTESDEDDEDSADAEQEQTPLTETEPCTESDEDDEDSADTEQEQIPLTETESCTESDEDEIITSGSKTVAEVEIEDEEPENEPESQIGDEEDENEAETKMEDVSEVKVKKDSLVCTEAVLHLLNQAFESRSALVLDPSMLDADVIYKQTVALAKTAAPGPRFRHRPRRPKRIAVKITEKVEEEGGDPNVDETKPVSDSKQRKDRPRSRDIGIPRNRDFDQEFSVQVSHGSLRVDELAKLLA